MSANAPKVLLRSEQSGGEVSIIELTRSGSPPLHRHDFDETFYLLEGELTFQLGDERFTRRAGELAFAPRGVSHTYANLSGAPARAGSPARRQASSATSTAPRHSCSAGGPTRSLPATGEQWQIRATPMKDLRPHTAFESRQE